MPVLTKNGKRYYFAHVPKTAGTSSYVWFYQNGYEIENLFMHHGFSTHKTFGLNFGVQQFKMFGKPDDYKGSMQHVTYDIWRDWGPFDGSFAIIRNPYARYKSEIKFLFDSYVRTGVADNTLQELNAFRQALYEKLQSDYFQDNSILDNHIRPQSDFLEQETKVFKLEGHCMDDIADYFNLKEKPPNENSSSKLDIELTQSEIKLINSINRSDLTRFSYKTKTPSSGVPDNNVFNELDSENRPISFSERLKVIIIETKKCYWNIKKGMEKSNKRAF